MAITDGTAVTMTAACEALGQHQACRKVVFSLTSGHLSDCACSCHTPDPVQDQELDDLLEQDDTRDDAWTAWAWS